ncbi:DNA-directed RNA polymerase I subunit RPA2 [Microplitis mediator]|uniref:DNA-directed RNA polymerase I subunit RPA2 n=1 Tax=Microplitis mediator TaxID=375433 RepID=UPI0025532882|nr:DNA-directed RNA polymerase I subunit RPA2 [Microplitis mediator]
MLEQPVLTNSKKDWGVPPEKQNPLLQTLGAPHLDSFNYMLEEGLDLCAKDIVPVYVKLSNEDRIKLWIDDIEIHQPRVPQGSIGVKNQKIYPTECRQRGSTYKGKLITKVAWSVNGSQQETLEKDLGEVPIMVKSNRCNLYGMDPKQLVKHKEHEQEWGGYFIIKGHERLIRMLQMNRRNYPIAIKRSGWKARGEDYSDLGLNIRCVKDDNTATTNTLHYVTDGSVKFMFTHRKTPYHIPVIMVLKCLYDATDYWIYKALTRGREDDFYYMGCVQNMLRYIHKEGLHTSQDVKNYVGKMFKIKFRELPDDTPNSVVCDFIMEKCVLIHLDDPEDKFQLLAFMTQKLFVLANEGCAVEGADAVMMQECLLGGHIYFQVMKEKLYSWLNILKAVILKRNKSVGNTFKLTVNEMLTAMKHTGSLDAQMENFLATGNIKTDSGLGLMQNTGLTIVAENINRMRYMSHFRAIHRGSFFQEMRTTEARQLLPDAWGFICPVHTPDGAPCGLLNHLAMDCIVTKQPKRELINKIPQELVALGMLPLEIIDDWKNSYTVMLDGRVLGIIYDSKITRITKELRKLKIKGTVIPNTTEIVLIPKRGDLPTQYPGLYIFTGPARMMRPVWNLQVGEKELIGTFEQVYLDIAVVKAERHEVTTHQEITKTSFLSNIARLIPMPDCNQSPRNMYQCQMGKQTMGTCSHIHQLQSECKLYRLQTPATPLFRPVHHDNINLDDFAMGTNAIVAVISYTGYDMEDAMVINKSAYERGFAHGMVYKSEFVDLTSSDSFFRCDPDKPELRKTLDADGFPNPGTRITLDDVYYCMYDGEEGRYITGKWKSKEDAFVDNVRLCGTLSSKEVKRACITFRVSRNPNVGDKFASRAGQKGICSIKFPAEDLPFTETGMIPDIIFNPHGFPSRMTIAMMIEFLAGKSAATHGLVHDATPFRFNENQTAIDYFGRCLEIGGFNYYGTEKMYSGTDGRIMDAAIFMGVVHYQRLRHMVEDKAQVRSTGPIDVLTQQPIKGRRRGGGVRFGEMERDALIAHGCSFLLRDRLFHCSDKSSALVCRKCGSLLGPVTEFLPVYGDKRSSCRLCDSDKDLYDIDIPYIFRYFVTELASLNIKVKLDFNFV